ncbi:hypothetical protein HYFRA_00006608 [Hymenoscyphus fraxineus]|uniref:Uncharacterized protein n=1 Tax=Hymenoscyphus fraxineus TaxID=746836 RepID=A0A9N9PHZ2_9HELO|nr:hypothetical protein HYFRA_00006608 [Hymenoscyphus fraxineus]
MAGNITEICMDYDAYAEYDSCSTWEFKGKWQDPNGTERTFEFSKGFGSSKASSDESSVLISAGDSNVLLLSDIKSLTIHQTELGTTSTWERRLFVGLLPFDYLSASEQMEVYQDHDMIELALFADLEARTVADQSLGSGGMYSQTELPETTCLRGQTNLITRLRQKMRTERFEAGECWLKPPIEIRWATKVEEEPDMTSTFGNMVTSSAEDQEIIADAIEEIQNVMNLHSLSPWETGIDKSLTNIFPAPIMTPSSGTRLGGLLSRIRDRLF